MLELSVMGMGFARWELLAKLEVLRLHSGRQAWPLRLPQLRELALLLWDVAPIMQALHESSLPRLEILSANIPKGEHKPHWGAPELEAFLRCPVFESLRELHLRSFERAKQGFGLELVEALLNTPMIARLERLDLRELLLTSEAKAMLEAERSRLPMLQLAYESGEPRT
jgi:hypothetical protein